MIKVNDSDVVNELKESSQLKKAIETTHIDLPGEFIGGYMDQVSQATVSLEDIKRTITNILGELENFAEGDKPELKPKADISEIKKIKSEFDNAVSLLETALDKAYDELAYIYGLR